MIDKKKLHDALRVMGTKYVKEPYKADWTPAKPTTGYCYVVAEVVYHYLAPKGSRPFVMKTGMNESHWFIRTPSNEVIDLTADQFDEPLDYLKGKPQNFLTKEISKRGKVLAGLLGY
jgi:hypothetical protein